MQKDEDNIEEGFPFTGSSYEAFLSLLVSLTADHVQMKKELECKHRELDSLKILLSDDIVGLKELLNAHNRTMELMDEEQNENLTSELYKLVQDTANLEEKFGERLGEKAEELKQAYEIIQQLEVDKKVLEENCKQVEWENKLLEVDKEVLQIRLKSAEITSKDLKHEIKALRKEVIILNRKIYNSLDSWCNYFWRTFQKYKPRPFMFCIAFIFVLPALTRRR